MMGSAYTRVGGEMEDEAQRGGRRSEEDMVDEKQQNGGSDLKF
jgi:hypothetical protein